MRYTLILLALLGASCSSTLPSVKPYHLDIQQGNVVTAKMMLQLKPGMTKSQVRYVLGTPLLQDSFHQNRWDYVYQMAKGGTVIERRRIILDFESDGLKAVRGDVIPAGATGAEDAPIASVTDLKTVKSDKTLLAEDPKTTWYDRFKFWGDDKDKVEKAADKTEVKPESKEIANQVTVKSWYDSLKFWESDKTPEAAKPVQASPVQKMPEPVVAETPQAPVKETLEPAKMEPTSEAAADANAVDAKVVAREIVDQVADQPAQITQSEKSEPAIDYKEGVAKAVDAWANAWRSKNVNAYLKAYSDKFKPDGMGKRAWLAQRQQRVGSKSGAITLVLEQVNIQADTKNATVTFVQRYASGNFSDVVNKALSFENANGQWLIVKELLASEVGRSAKSKVSEEAYVKPRDVTADEKSETMPEKMLQESAKEAQQAKPEVKAAPAPEAKPVEVKQPDVKAETQKAPVNKKDVPLPPEDAPDFFERMLEKIGF